MRIFAGGLRRRGQALLAVFLGLAAFGLAQAPAQAHFLLNGQNRTVVLERQDDALMLYLRIPTPLVYAGFLAERSSPTDRVEAPFIVANVIDGRTVHYLDVAAIQADPAAFGALVADGYRVDVNGREAAAQVEGVRIRPVRDQVPFATPEEAGRALASDPASDGRLFVGDTVVDIALRYPDVDGFGDVTVASSLPELQLPPGMFVDNHFIDFRRGEAVVTNVAGQLREPVLLDASILRSAWTFVVQGIRHILEGADHVLFVLCLAIGAISIGQLLWQVTGFTIGHSITLIAGFLSLAPTAAWFTPAIETAIALSIVYAGLIVLLRVRTRSAILITTLIGLLHGFGFSFVLGEILGRDAPHLLVSLLSFNLGVEIGQIAIVAVAFAGFALAAWLSGRFSRLCRIALAGGAVAIACLWVVERVGLIVDSLG